MTDEVTDIVLEEPGDDAVEPGEVPSTEVVSDKVVNVLEDILGGADNCGQVDELQKELDGTTTSTTPRAKKSQKVKAGSAKRKSTRKSKSTPAKSKSTPSPAPAPKKETEISNTAEVPKDEAPKKAEVVAAEVIMKPVKVKTEVPEQKEEIAAVEIPVETKPVVKAEPKVVEKIIKKEKLPAPVEISTDVEMEKVDDPPKQVKTVTTKTVKKVKKTSSKKESKKEAPSTKVAAEDKTKKEENSISKDETVKLNEKIKALEKKVTTQNQTTPSTEKTTTAETKEVVKKEIKKNSTKTASDRKRKSIPTTGKDVKSKKSTKPKVKVEKLEKNKEQVVKDVAVKPDAAAATDHPMRVVDDVDGSQSDHGSYVSHGGSSFSHTYSGSRSGSFSGSFTGTFSDSLSLSSFTGSHASIEFSDNEDIKEAEDEVKKKKRRKISQADVEEADDIQNHKDFIDSLLKGARYFIVKSNNHENVTLSKAKGVWSTPPANERKLNDAYRHSTNVILIYSVKESGRFQGFARLASESRRDTAPVAWVVPPGFDPRILGATFKVDWLNRKEVQFSQCTNLRNPWNENKEVKICRDGQEVEPSVGEVLCRMFEDDLTVDLSRVARHLKQRKHLGDNFRKREHHNTPRFRGGYNNRGNFRGDWRGGRGGGFRGNYRGNNDRVEGGYRGRYNNRRGGSGYFRRGSSDFRGGRGRYEDNRGRHNDNYQHNDRFNNRYNDRERSRSPMDRRHGDRDSRDRRHKDKVKEFLKNESRSKFGVRKETLLHGSYSDYVREFHKQKQYRGPGGSSSSSYYQNHHYQSGGRSDAYDPTKAAAEEFLRRTSRR